MLFGKEKGTLDDTDVKDSIERRHGKSPIDANIKDGEENSNGDDENDKYGLEDFVEDHLAIFDIGTFNSLQHQL